MKSTTTLKKNLGQNFLVDRRIQQKIIEHCGLSDDDDIIEIGPGAGVMTRLVSPHVRRLMAVETDGDLVAPLQQEFAGSNAEVIHADFLRWPFPAGGPFKVVGNIPYYISTPIIERLIAERAKVRQAFLTVQLEFGERLAAAPGNKTYGSLSCFVQYHAKVNVFFKIRRNCFKPAPNVDSCFLCLDFEHPPSFKPHNEQALFKVIRTAFTQRRKNILNALGSLVDKARLTRILEELEISPNKRPEQLNLENFIDISNRVV
jgi:16S rRNA (adenine1518-N6/adenine1519-N6)-dimethyltransferase